MTNLSLIFTDSAAKKVAELIAEEGNFALHLRVYITGGGCSGFQYGFMFDENINPDDTVITKGIKKLSSGSHLTEGDEDDEGDSGSGNRTSSLQATTDNDDDDEGDAGTGKITVSLVVDPMSFQYLVGAEIDYREDANGSQFVIRNPNAKTTCGCGSSFSA